MDIGCVIRPSCSRKTKFKHLFPYSEGCQLPDGKLSPANL